MLAARGLRLSFGSRTILDDATCVFDDTERTALVGDNGAGKSTLLSLLAGLQKQEGGTVERGRGQTLAMLGQEPQLDLEHSAREAVATAGGEPWEVDEYLSRLKVSDPDALIQNLSGGQRRRVDLARVLMQQADILLLDEPTNHLDQHAIAFVVERVRKHRGPVIIISHDRAFLDETCTRVVELSRGKLHIYAPPTDKTLSLTTSFIEQKMIRDDVQSRTQHKKERLWIRELAWLRAGTPARTTKQQARIDRAGELSAFVDAEADAIRDKRKRVDVEMQRSQRLGRTIIEAKNLGIDRGEKVLFRDLNLVVTKGQRWGVVGDNGAGKTSFLLAIQTACGAELDENQQVRPVSGSLTVGDNTKIAVFDQHREKLDPNATLEATLAADNDHVFMGETRIHVSSYLERFLFDGSDRKRQVRTLSGGEQNRLVLARLFLGDANVLLLDEPTNDLDVTTLGVLEDALLAHDGCAFIISHDRRFLDRVATGILAFEKAPGEEGPSTVTPVIGDWTHYVRTQQERVAALIAAASSPSSSTSTSSSTSSSSSSSSSATSSAPAVAAPKARKRSFKEEREFSTMEATILVKETRREELRAAVMDPEVMKDGAKAKAVSDELAALDVEVDALYLRWQMLSDLSAM